MLDLILSLFSGSGGILVAAGAALIAVVAAFFRGRKAERNANRAKEADAYEKHLKDVAGAHDARNRIDPDSVPDKDPYRRD